MRTIPVRVIMALLFVPLLSCESLSQRERDILEYSQDKIKTYEDRLVDLQSYTTEGGRYHQKYKRYLIGIAQYLTEKKNMPLVQKSIGFYFDKATSNNNRTVYKYTQGKQKAHLQSLLKTTIILLKNIPEVIK